MGTRFIITSCGSRMFGSVHSDGRCGPDGPHAPL